METAQNKIITLSAANANRKSQYRIRTDLCRENGQTHLIKIPDNGKAKEFLHNIIQREQISKKFFGDKIKVITGTMRKGNIYYPYLKYPTLQDLIAESIMKEDGTLLVKRYTEFIHSLPKYKCKPIDFMQEFKISLNMIEKPLECLEFGPVDFIPSNILVDKEKWFVIDHEWTYGFPVPVDFVIYRGIISLVINLQQEIQSNVSSYNPVTLFCGYLNNRTYIPIKWLDFLNSLAVPIERLYYWDWLFKSRVFINYKLGNLRLNEKQKAIKNLKPVSQISIARKNNNKKNLKWFSDCLTIAFLKGMLNKLLTIYRKRKFY